MARERYLLCVHCSPVKHLEDLAQLNKHLRTVHPHLPSYQCGHCKTSFIHKTSMIRHIEVLHASGGSSPSVSVVGDSSSSHPHTSAVSSGGGGQDDDDDEDVEQEDYDDNNLVPAVTDPEFDLKTEAALFLLNLRSSGNITHASVKLIQDYVTELLQNVLQDAGNKTFQFLSSCGVTPDQSAPFISGDTFKPDNPFEGLSSIEDQLNYFCDKYGMVVPEEKYLGYRIENRFDKEARTFIPKQVPETFQYVSVVETLKLILRSPIMRSYIECENQSTDGVYRSFKDGSDFKGNRFLRKFPNTIRLSIYLDDLEITNALGSKDVIHKLGCFYFSIQNLPPEESSQLSSVFLFALTCAEDLKSHEAYAKVLKPLIDEVQILMSEEGVVLNLPEGGTYTIRACVVSLCADSLAAHSILGFMSPSAKMFCRMCLISSADLCEDSAAMGRPRTSKLHKQHLKKVADNPAFRSQFGVERRSPLLDIMKVPEDSVFDAFHDLVGVIQMELKLALYEFICVRNLFKSEDFNNNINMFSYGKPDIKNKPSPNFLRRKLCETGHSLKQSGSQTICLLRVFPFIITGVEVDDPYLELIHLLQDIVRIILSFEVRDSDILTLENLLKEHHDLFHRTFVSPATAERGAQVVNPDDEDFSEGDDDEGADEADNGQNEHRRRGRQSRVLKKGINKMHHLMHYPQQMKEKGPIIRLWCAKYEGRHRIFRKHAGVQCNFKNPPKTMARMFQLSTLGPILAKKETRRGEEITLIAGATTALVGKSPFKDMLLREGLDNDDSIDTVQSAERCGVEYCQGLFVVLNGGSKSHPSFALIDNVLVVNKPTEPSKLFLIVLKCQSNGLCARYNAFSISNDFSAVPELVNVDILANFRTIAPWNPVCSANPGSLYLYPRSVFL